MSHQSIDNLAENPLRRTWRGNKEGMHCIRYLSAHLTYLSDDVGTIELESVPKFESPYEEREWIKAHMAAAFRYWGKMGFAEGVSGHITVRDPVLPDHYW